MTTSDRPQRGLPRVMVIGLDGATFDVIQPWVQSGLLPTFQGLMEGGAWGPLKSAMPPVTPTAWTSMITGLNPGKHDIFDFFARRPGGYDTYLVNATHRRGEPVWSLLSQAGHRPTVFNVPATYPPDEINGQMVSGLLTPSSADDASWPRSLLAELKQAVPEFGFYPPGIFSPGQESAFVSSVLAWDQMSLRAAEFLMQRQPWDFLFTVFNGIDIVSHFMWQPLPAHGTRPPASAGTLDAVREVYRQADAIVARLLDLCADDTWVMVVSDHGFGPLDYYMHLNAWLAGRGYLKFRRSPLVLLKTLAFRLGLAPVHLLDIMRRMGLGGRLQQAAGEHNAGLRSLAKRVFLSMADVDWKRTVAYSAGFGGPILINLKGREPQGIVEPGDEYEALLGRLQADLGALRHPLTGEPFARDFYRPADLYQGPYTSHAPDLSFTPYDWRNQGYGLHDFASNRWLERSTDRTGTHRMDGVLILHGPGVVPGRRLEGADLCDIAPTILSLMGVPIPRQVDGRVLLPAFEPEMGSRLAVTYRDADDGAVGPDAGPAMSEAEEEQIRRHLAALGYLG